MLNFQHKNDCEGHQQSNLEWHYVKKIDVTRSTIYVENFILVSKQQKVGTMLLYLYIVAVPRATIN